MAMKELGQVRCLCVHHSASHDGDVERFRREHRERGFEDVGYHAVILKSGEVQAGRSEKFQGAGVFGANAGKLHVCLVGNFETEAPTNEQLASLGNWLLNRLHKWPEAVIRGHSEAAVDGHGTLCPGKWMRERLSSVRDWVAARKLGKFHGDLPDFLGEARGTPTEADGGAEGAKVAATEAALALIGRDVRIEVKGYVSEATKRKFSPRAVEVDGSVFVSLRDLIQGLDWADPEDVLEDDEGDRKKKVMVVATKRNVREARASLSGGPRELGGAE